MENDPRQVICFRREGMTAREAYAYGEVERLRAEVERRAAGALVLRRSEVVKDGLVEIRWVVLPASAR